MPVISGQLGMEGDGRKEERWVGVTSEGQQRWFRGAERRRKLSSLSPLRKQALPAHRMPTFGKPRLHPRSQCLPGSRGLMVLAQPAGRARISQLSLADGRKRERQLWRELGRCVRSRVYGACACTRVQRQDKRLEWEVPCVVTSREQWDHFRRSRAVYDVF